MEKVRTKEHSLQKHMTGNKKLFDELMVKFSDAKIQPIGNLPSLIKINKIMSDAEAMRYIIEERELQELRRLPLQGTTSCHKHGEGEYERELRRMQKYYRNMKEFTEKDLVSFGNYLLSEERNANIASEENRNVVGDWDVANWKENERDKR